MLQFFFFILVLIGCVVYNKYFDKDEENQKIGELQTLLEQQILQNQTLASELAKSREKFEKLQHQKISADVKMGQKSENLLPFLHDFKYKDEEIRGLFNPIDLVVFGEDHVTFVEIKTGEAQLSEKQRKIRDNIKAGKVFFEVHRMNEKGVTVK